MGVSIRCCAETPEPGSGALTVDGAEPRNVSQVAVVPSDQELIFAGSILLPKFFTPVLAVEPRATTPADSAPGLQRLGTTFVLLDGHMSATTTRILRLHPPRPQRETAFDASLTAQDFMRRGHSRF